MGHVQAVPEPANSKIKFEYNWTNGSKNGHSDMLGGN